MKKTITLLLLSCALIGLTNCQKDFFDTVTTRYDGLDAYDSSFYRELAQSSEDTSIKLSTVKFEDGTNVLDVLKIYDPDFLIQNKITPRRRTSLTPNEQLRVFQSRMIAAGLDFCDDDKYKNWMGSEQPNGLAYVWGVKNHQKPCRPSCVVWENNECKEVHQCQVELHGMDCSGLVYQAIIAAGMPPLALGNCVSLRDTAIWNKHFKNHPEFNGLIAVHYKPSVNFTQDSLKTGDIIFKTGGGNSLVHAGIYTSGRFYQDRCMFIQSNGPRQSSCGEALQSNSGPRMINWSKAEAFSQPTKKYGKEWEIVRIQTICPEPLEPINIQKVGDAQMGLADEFLPNSLGLMITDRLNQGCACFTVNWKIISGNGYIKFDSTKTNHDGKTFNAWKIGSEKIHQVEATIVNSKGMEITGSPIVFTAALDTNYILRRMEKNLVLVEGDTFTMGCTPEQMDGPFGGCRANEKPAHLVKLSDFRIGKFEVTQEEWKDVMGSNPSNNSVCLNCPVEQVSWDDIQVFISKLNARTGLNYRLPTEAEWEFAARGGKLTNRTMYSGSGDLSTVGWFGDNANRKPQAVGQLAANELGLYDMSGNVFEWCSDWYGIYGTATETNPQGPADGIYRIIRGGSVYDGDVRYFRVASRQYEIPENNFRFGIGFRLVVPVP
jgi:formylglycine-generating enzyme required for sulfatase activity